MSTQTVAPPAPPTSKLPADGSGGESVLPFYLVGDESGSMTGAPIEAINDELPGLHQAIASDPDLADRTRFSVIAFSDHAEVLLELSNLEDVESMPALTAQGGTNYEAAFDLLLTKIVDDVARLKADGYTVLRPAVFFMSDGFPNGPEWNAAYDRLVSAPVRPNILAFAVGEADPDIIAKVANVAAFQVDDGVSTASALREFVSRLVRSIVHSVGSVAAGRPALAVPTNIPGFHEIDIDTV